MQIRDKLYIGGEWVPPSSMNSINVVSPATEEVIGTVPEAGERDVSIAVRAAREAFQDWANTSAAERSNLLRKIHEGMKARSEEIGRTIALEVGMPLKLATRIQAGSPTYTFGMYAKMLSSFSFEERIGNSLVLREPVGIAACITPWNYPLHQIAAKVAPALAAGCTVVLKPSEVAPLNAFILAEIVHAAGVPRGVFNLVTGYGSAVGEDLVGHPEVDLVSFTGSTRAGKRISELCAQSIKRLALELGGKSASVILDDADLGAAVKGTVTACFLNSGQTCSAHTRMLVHETVYEQAAKLAVEVASTFAVGDPFAESTRLGPLVSRTQRDRVQDYIKKGIEEGAELLCGGVGAPEGLPKGWYVKPTVFGRVDPNASIAREEIFGPVLSIIPYKSEDDAVRIANDTMYGLAGGVWSNDEERAKRVARRIRAGQIDINGAPFNMHAPFGGFKQSGYGRELGRFGMDEFLEYKSIQFKQ